MDPAAVEELHRLYRKKLAKDEGRPAKRRKLQRDDSNDSGDSSSSDSGADQGARELSSPGEDSEDSFEHFGDEEALPDSTSTSNEVQIISFDERNLGLSEAGAVRGYKSFMSGKIPKLGLVPVTSSKKSNGNASDDEDSEDDLRKDKELQRLLRESHLLHEQCGTSLETQGKIRQKAIAQQLISNGAAAPAARKMPIGMRKGIQAAARKREAAQDKYKRDAGIVGARKSSSTSATASSVFSTQQKHNKKQNKTLHELNLGKYKNGKLSITRKEIDRINATDRKAGGGRGGKGKNRGFRTFSNIG